MSEATARVWNLQRFSDESTRLKSRTNQSELWGVVGSYSVMVTGQPGPRCHHTTKVHQEVTMTRRTAFNGSAAGRRRERRAAVQSAVAVSAENMHRPTPSRAQVQAKGQHHTPASIEEAAPIKFIAQDAVWQRQEYKRQLERAAIVYSNEFGNKPLESGMCLPDVAIYAAGHRKSKSITAR